MSRVDPFMAPGPWITRDLKLCVLAKDYYDAIEWIKASPHRSSCASYGLPDKYQGQQHPCTCGRNALLGL